MHKLMFPGKLLVWRRRGFRKNKREKEELDEVMSVMGRLNRCNWRESVRALDRAVMLFCLLSFAAAAACMLTFWCCFSVVAAAAPASFKFDDEKSCLSLLSLSLLERCTFWHLITGKCSLPSSFPQTVSPCTGMASLFDRGSSSSSCLSWMSPGMLQKSDKSFFPLPEREWK